MEIGNKLTPDLLYVFPEIPLPKEVEGASLYREDALKAIERFIGKPWMHIQLADLIESEEAFFFFTPEAYRYYLPSVMLPVLEDAIYPEILDTILHTLVRSPNYEQWEDGFKVIWNGFTVPQLEAMELFIVHLGLNHLEDTFPIHLETILRTLSILIGSKKAPAQRSVQLGT